MFDSAQRVVEYLVHDIQSVVLETPALCPLLRILNGCLYILYLCQSGRKHLSQLFDRLPELGLLKAPNDTLQIAIQRLCILGEVSEYRCKTLIKIIQRSPMTQAMTQHHHIEQSQGRNKQQYNQNVEYPRVGCHLLQPLAVRGQCSIGAIKAVQAYTLGITTAIDVPLPDGLSCNGLFIIECDKQRCINWRLHLADCTVGIETCFGITPFEIGCKGRIIKISYISRHGCAGETKKQKRQQWQYPRQSEPEAASLPKSALHPKVADAEKGRELAIAVNNTLAVHNSEAKALVCIRGSYMTGVIDLAVAQGLHIL